LPFGRSESEMHVPLFFFSDYSHEVQSELRSCREGDRLGDGVGWEEGEFTSTFRVAVNYLQQDPESRDSANQLRCLIPKETAAS
jgi:hypothetical protein